MNKTMMTILGGAAILMTMAAEAEAASARVRCRVEPGRLRIQVDGQDLAVGTYGAKVKNARTGVVIKTEAAKLKKVTLAPDDVDLDFDTTANSADLDSYVAASFASPGDTLRASVVLMSNGVTVAAASTTCVRK